MRAMTMFAVLRTQCSFSKTTPRSCPNMLCTTPCPPSPRPPWPHTLKHAASLPAAESPGAAGRASRARPRCARAPPRASAHRARLAAPVLTLHMLHQRDCIPELPRAVRAALQAAATAAAAAGGAGRVERLRVEQQLLQRAEALAALWAGLARAARRRGRAAAARRLPRPGRFSG